jgi:hypothetical protein
MLHLIRVAEHHTGASWPVIARELDRIHAIDLAGTAGTVRQRTEITPDAQAILSSVGRNTIGRAPFLHYREGSRGRGRSLRS